MGSAVSHTGISMAVTRESDGSNPWFWYWWNPLVFVSWVPVIFSDHISKFLWWNWFYCFFAETNGKTCGCIQRLKFRPIVTSAFDDWKGPCFVAIAAHRCFHHHRRWCATSRESGQGGAAVRGFELGDFIPNSPTMHSFWNMMVHKQIRGVFWIWAVHLRYLPTKNNIPPV